MGVSEVSDSKMVFKSAKKLPCWKLPHRWSSLYTALVTADLFIALKTTDRLTALKLPTGL